jgi:hypothetical protein
MDSLICTNHGRGEQICIKVCLEILKMKSGWESEAYLAGNY